MSDDTQTPATPVVEPVTTEPVVEPQPEEAASTTEEAATTEEAPANS